MTEFLLEGKVALITGASRGIGRAIALRLAQAGARVVVSSRKMENVQPVADEIRATGGEALAVQSHVGRTDDVTALVEQTMETFGRVDVAVNNVATNPHFGPLLTAEEADLEVKAGWIDLVLLQVFGHRQGYRRRRHQNG